MTIIPRTAPRYAMDAAHDSVATTVALGESFVVETHDCRTGTITRSDQVDELRDTRFVNPATGPITIEGVDTGETLCIEIEELHLDSLASGSCSRAPGTTALQVTDEPQLRIVECDDQMADVGSFRIPIAPMIGVIGVAPAEGAVPTFRGGDHGGNMDTRLIGAASKVFLTTFVPGGKVYFGDVHAAMGDGEVFLSGIEIAGRIRARVTRRSVGGFQLPAWKHRHDRRHRGRCDA